MYGKKKQEFSKTFHFERLNVIEKVIKTKDVKINNWGINMLKCVTIEVFEHERNELAI